MDYYKGKKIPIPHSRQTGILHKTVDPLYGEVTADFVIKTINDLILKPNNVELYVCSKKSMLYPEIPYFWN